MKIREILSEQIANIAQEEVARSAHDVALLPKLRNQDPYLQYRMGLAMASARAVAAGEVEFNEESLWGENMIVTSYTDADIETLDMALKLMPNYNLKRSLTKPGSSENADTNRTSPVIQRKKNRYGV